MGGTTGACVLDGYLSFWVSKLLYCLLKLVYMLPCSDCPGYVGFTPMGNWGPDAQAWHYPTSPTGRSEDGDSPASAAAAVRVTAGLEKSTHATEGADASEPTASAPGCVAGEEEGLEGEFRCAAVYPCAETSLELGRKNLHLFR
jgi:hypothetical protein